MRGQADCSGAPAICTQTEVQGREVSACDRPSTYIERSTTALLGRLSISSGAAKPLLRDVNAGKRLACVGPIMKG